MNFSESCPYFGIKIKRLTPYLNNHCKKFINKIDRNNDFQSFLTNISFINLSINNANNINNNKISYNNKIIILK